MKTKKLIRKLTLNKETVTNLGSEMKNVLGGGSSCYTECNQYTCADICTYSCDNPMGCYPDSMDTCFSCIYENTNCLAW